jgi:hypothetical protein
VNLNLMRTTVSVTKGVGVTPVVGLRDTSLENGDDMSLKRRHAAKVGTETLVCTKGLALKQNEAILMVGWVVSVNSATFVHDCEVKQKGKLSFIDKAAVSLGISKTTSCLHKFHSHLSNPMV